MMYETVVEWLSWGWPRIIDHLWQATLFAMLVLGISRLLRRGPARARYALWLVASLKFVLPSALFIFIAGKARLDLSVFQSSPVSSVEHLAAVSVIRPISSLDQTNIIEAVQRFDDLYVALTIVWLIGFILLTGVWLRRRAQFALAIKTGKAVTTGREAEALQRARKRLAITRKIRLVLLPVLIEPGVFGTRRPVIVMPEGIADHLSDDELEAVAMHEVAHVGRWDNVVGNLQMLLCCLLWFHPFVWFIDRRLLVERERACDEAVVRVSGAAGSYASGILKVCRFCLGWRMAGVSGMARVNLRQRIAQITSRRVDEGLRISHRLALGFTAAFLIVFSLAGADFGRQGVEAQRDVQSTARSGGALSEVSAETLRPGESDQENSERANNDGANVNMSAEVESNARQPQEDLRKNRFESGQKDRGGPGSPSRSLAAVSIPGTGQPGAGFLAQDQRREVSPPDLDEIKRRAMEEHPEDAADASIVVVVNQKKQVTTTRADSKVTRP